jgi:Delta3-Delta2-enoyl-CoA isomerase
MYSLLIYMALDRLQALIAAVEEAESHPKIQALILQSNAKTTFSAGLDIMEMHKPEMDRLRSFWKSFQTLYLSLYGSRLACIAAIEGHAPAAGCMLALSCDYRIMAATDTSHDDVKQHWQPKIGLNETKLGIVAPPWLAQQMIDCVGVRQAELSLSLGTLYSPEEALNIHLVDCVVPLDEVRAKAVIEAKKFGSIPQHARVASKMLIREPHLEKLTANADQDVDHFVGFVTNKKVQQNISAYLELLSKKRK